MPIRLPLFLRTMPTSSTVRHRCGLAACILSSLALLSGCAKDPPSSTSSIALSGKRLRVTIQFASAVNPNYHYYFLINYDQSVAGGNQNGIGPVAVLGPVNSNQGYGNGFATGSNGSAYGFTDFVKYENNTYRLLHVVGDPTLGNFVDEGQPVAFTLPNAGNPTQLQFDIDLSQIVVQSNGAALPSSTQTVSQALAIHWLQMNIVATDVVPINQTTVVAKQVDSLGNTQTASGASSFLDLDISQFKTYANQDFAGQSVFEPQGDVYGSANPDPALDIINYTIAVVQQ